MPGTITNFKSHFTSGKAAMVDRIEKVEGRTLPKPVQVKVLMKSDNILMLEIFRPKGLKDPVHQHDDHETQCHLVKGRCKLVIGDREFIAEAGDSWFHPKGMPHWSEALEDSIQIEVKSPPVKTW